MDFSTEIEGIIEKMNNEIHLKYKLLDSEKEIIIQML